MSVKISQLYNVALSLDYRNGTTKTINVTVAAPNQLAIDRNSPAIAKAAGGDYQFASIIAITRTNNTILTVE